MHPDAWREPNLYHPHNIVLDFWLRLGVLGLAALAAGALAFAVQVRDAWRAGAGDGPAGSVSRMLAAGASGMAVALVAHGLLDNSYFVLDLAYATWVMLLIAELATQPGTQSATRRSQSPQAVARGGRQADRRWAAPSLTSLPGARG
jgi:O-antigen ligase